MKFPLPVTFAFEDCNATVQYTTPLDQTQRPHPHLYIQAIDAYAYQRELIILTKYGVRGAIYFDIKAGQHPYWRIHTEIENGEEALNKILDVCKTHPHRLFNPAGDFGKNKGFVHLHTSILFNKSINLSLF
jgi:hypothetical protein